MVWVKFDGGGWFRGYIKDAAIVWADGTPSKEVEWLRKRQWRLDDGVEPPSDAPPPEEVDEDEAPPTEESPRAEAPAPSGSSSGWRKKKRSEDAYQAWMNAERDTLAASARAAQEEAARLAAVAAAEDAAAAAAQAHAAAMAEEEEEEVVAEEEVEEAAANDMGDGMDGW